jgi:hypothetical protein
MLCGAGFTAESIRIGIFPVYVGQCLSPKVVRCWLAKVSVMAKGLKQRCRSG